MSVLIATILYWLRIVRQPIDPRLKRRYLGGFLIVVLGVGLVWLWDTQRRPGQVSGQFWGEVLGVLSVYVMCWSLLLATRMRLLEPWFGGLDRMYLWHRRTAIAGFMLFIVHVIVVRAAQMQGASQVGNALGVLALFGLMGLVAISLPRISRLLHLSYELWLLVHRTIGLFVAIAVVHGALVDPMLKASFPLQATYGLVGLVGLLAYGYKELLASHVERPAAYVVRNVDRPTRDILDVTLAAASTTAPIRPGQFLFLSFGGASAWQRHPFSVAGIAPDGTLRLSIRALGDYTRALYDRLEPGVPARVSAPYGMFDYTLGGARQIWIAGGSGVVPFLSWLRQPEALTGRTIDFFYAAHSRAEAPYLDEILAFGERDPQLRIHAILSAERGRLTAEQIQAESVSGLAGTHVFLCGPTAMTEGLSRRLRKMGVPRDQIHFEHFAFR